MALPTTQQFLLCAVALLCAISVSGHAQESGARYSVQIGAYASPAPGLRESLVAFGSVSIDNSGELSRYLVGNFSNRGEAELLRDELQREGFADAFVRSIGGGPAAPSHSAHHHRDIPAAEQSKLDALSAEQRSNVVYLDGVLHLKEGDTFRPLQ
ncbi:MAG: SPOR domain-containing protein [Pseudomonadales bacterium]